VAHDEDDLIRQSQSGDATAFSLLAERYERRIYSLALHYCRDRQDAEDLSQEAWLKAYQALGSFRYESGFYTWLRKITINCFLNYQRSRSFRRHLQTTSNETLKSNTITESSLHSTNLETTLQNRILVSRVMQSLAEVTAHQRLIFLLKHHEGMTSEEIARALGCSTGTVKKSLSRTVAILRKHLESNNESRDYLPCAAEQY